MKKLLILLFMFTVSGKVFAVCTPKYCEGVDDEVVESIYLNETGNIYLKAPTDKAALNCTLEEGQNMILEQNHPLFKEIYSIILTAISTSRKLRVRIVEGSPNCRVTYAVMY